MVFLLGVIAFYSVALVASFSMSGRSTLRPAVFASSVLRNAQPQTARRFCASKTEIEGGKMSPAEWIREVFGNLKPRKYLIDKQYCGMDTASCIIDSPSNTMANPLLGINLAETAYSVLNVSTMPINDQSKPIFVTVRGVGGGKTRLMEEMRRFLLLDESVLPIAITFNGYTYLSNVEFYEKCGDGDCGRSAALFIVSRLAAAFYESNSKFRHDDCIMRMHLNRPKLADKFIAADLYTAFIQLMRDQLHSFGKTVEKVVLLVDGNVHLHRILKYLYPNEPDPLADLRTAVMEQTPGGALVLASLNGTLKGFEHGRPMQVLPLPEALDATQVVTQWWNITTSSLISRFVLVAAMLCDQPRGLEIVNNFIVRHRSELHRSDIREKMLDFIQKEMRGHYPLASANPLPSPALLHALWFQESCALDHEAQRYIRSSLFTNVLDIQQILGVSVGDKSVQFIPRVNLFLLESCEEDHCRFDVKFLAILGEFIGSIFATTSKTQARKVMRRHITMALVSRVGVSVHAGRTITPAQLLGLSDTEEVRQVSALTCDIHLTPSMENIWTWNVPQLRYHSNNPDESPAYYKELESIEVSEKRPVALRRGAPGDAFDHLLKVFDPSAPGGFRYIAVNSAVSEVTWKMKEGVDRRAAGPRVRFPYKNGAQAATFCDAMCRMVDVAYVYLTNHPQEQCVKKYVPEDRTKQREGVCWVYAGEQELQKFMGPMWDVHRAYRAF